MIVHHTYNFICLISDSIFEIMVHANSEEWPLLTIPRGYLSNAGAIWAIVFYCHEPSYKFIFWLAHQYYYFTYIRTMFVPAETTVAFGPNFGYVIIIGTLIALEVVIFARIFGGMPRKVFSSSFMQSNFGQAHKEAFGQEIGAGGHPDVGSGLYSHKLSYKEWFEFNNCQRVHLHFVEWVATYLFLLIGAGVYFPITSAAIGLAIFLVRIWYAVGYVVQGPKGRVIPFIINVLLTSALGCVAIVSGIKHISNQ